LRRPLALLSNNQLQKRDGTNASRLLLDTADQPQQQSQWSKQENTLIVSDACDTAAEYKNAQARKHLLIAPVEERPLLHTADLQPATAATADMQPASLKRPHEAALNGPPCSVSRLRGEGTSTAARGETQSGNHSSTVVGADDLGAVDDEQHFSSMGPTEAEETTRAEVVVKDVLLPCASASTTYTHQIGISGSDTTSLEDNASRCQSRGMSVTHSEGPCGPKEAARPAEAVRVMAVVGQQQQPAPANDCNDLKISSGPVRPSTLLSRHIEIIEILDD
jgi:hypothetical protein